MQDQSVTAVQMRRHLGRIEVLGCFVTMVEYSQSEREVFS
jgi:hypothetical protein